MSRGRVLIPEQEAPSRGDARDRLQDNIDVLRVALHAYLTGLRSVWEGGPEDEVDRLLSAVGTQPAPSAQARAKVEQLVRQGRAHNVGPFCHLVRALHLDLGRELLVAAGWWAEADPQFATVLGCAHDDAARRYASVAQVRLVLAPFGIDVPPEVDHDPLVANGVFESGAGASGPLRLTPTARETLAGRLPTPLASDPPPDRLLRHVAALARQLANHEGCLVMVRGPAGAGRRAMAIAAVRAAGFLPVDGARPIEELRLVVRLGIAVPVVPVEDAGKLDWRPADGSLVAWAGPEANPGECGMAGAHLVEVAGPSFTECRDHWRRLLTEKAELTADLASELARSLAARFTFTEGDIASTVARSLREGEWQERPVDEELIWAAARRQPEQALNRLATLVAPANSLSDLVVTPDTRRELRDLIAHVALQHVVLDEWGFRRRMPRGQGVAALFTGPPGTGKTMAVEALAGELHQDLYRIDLSCVVSKYIGETEKNLSSAFDEAERAGAVLFFDEADSLFGKRTEVHDAHDRYANLEVNYLLQRVEAFTGLVILASNRGSALDEAFLRRLRFVIRFEMPSLDMRRELWERSLPADRCGGSLDWDALATLELSGGSICNAALHAAFMAAAEGGSVTDVHLTASLRREYDKLGKAWPGLTREVRA